MPDTLELTEAKLLEEWTVKYFNFIKEQLEEYGTFVEHVNNISFLYDKDMLYRLCNENGISVEETSTYGDNYGYAPINRIEYKYGRAQINRIEDKYGQMKRIRAFRKGKGDFYVSINDKKK